MHEWQGGDLVRGTQIIICSQSLIVLFNLFSSKVLNVLWNQVQETSENRLGIDYINLAKTVLKNKLFPDNFGFLPKKKPFKSLPQPLTAFN